MADSTVVHPLVLRAMGMANDASALLDASRTASGEIDLYMAKRIEAHCNRATALLADTIKFVNATAGQGRER